MMLRNKILTELERAETEEDPEERKKFLNFVIVGGGPSGVEIAGALAEMKANVLPRDYPDLMDRMHIYLVDSGQRLLKAMDEKSSQRAYEDLRRMNVHVRFGWRVTDYKDNIVTARNSETNEIKPFLRAASSGSVASKPTALRACLRKPSAMPDDYSATVSTV